MNDLNWEPKTGSAAIDCVLASCYRYAERTAICLGDAQLTYGDLLQRAQAIACFLRNKGSGPVALVAHRSIEDFPAVLGIFLSGRTYVPLSAKTCAEVACFQLQMAGVTAVLSGRPQGLFTALSTATEARHFLLNQIPKTGLAALGPCGDVAYIMSTSGSSGPPKSVPIRHANLTTYIGAANTLSDLQPSDRATQLFDLSFDLSLHDMFITWAKGAALIVPTETERLDLVGFVARHAITSWFSTPSHAKLALRRKACGSQLKTLRRSLFCGEPLSWDLANTWADLTSGQVENWYGPTETTIAATRYVVAPGTGAGQGSIVPIGTPLDGIETQISDDGELHLSGAQVFDGYLGSTTRTNAVYATGDLVFRDALGQLHFKSRANRKIKLQGRFVDLDTLESKLAGLAGCNAKVLTWPPRSVTAETLVGVLETAPPIPKKTLQNIRANMPAPLSGSTFCAFAEFPLSVAGKTDIAALEMQVRNKLQDARPKRPRKRLHRLISCAQEINPTLTEDDLLKTPNLMDAGLDSLGFTQFIAQLETQFDVELNQSDVAALSQMTVRQMLVALRQKTDLQTGATYQNASPQLPLPQLRANRHYRAMRTLDFLDKFPEFLANSTRPLVPFVGSSGFMRAIDPKVIQTVAQHYGQSLAPINAGMAMLSNLGILELCTYLAECAKEAGLTFPMAVLELELLHLSTLPPAGDVEIVRAYQNGEFKHTKRLTYDPDTQWNAAMAGGLLVKQGPLCPRAEPARWESRRHDEVRRIFDGDIALDQNAIDVWFQAISVLHSVSSEVVAVVHPLDGYTSQLRHQKGYLHSLTEQITTKRSLRVILDDAFDLQPHHFRNFSHVNARGGRHAFSLQLGKHLFAPTA